MVQPEPHEQSNTSQVTRDSGSTNFDNRSFRLNDEASLNVYDEEFAQHMTEVFERDLTKAKPYSYSMWKIGHSVKNSRSMY